MKTLVDTNYDFPVRLQNVFTQKSEDADYNDITGRRAVVRQDSGAMLGIVSDKYELLKHGDVINAFRNALKDVEFKETIAVMNGGATLFATYSLPAHTVEVKKGDLVSLQFVVKNSYNGANALQMMLGAYRLVCTNGMTIGKQFFSYSQKHIGSASGIQIGVIQQKVALLTEQFGKTLPLLQEMSNHALTASSEELFTKELIPFPKYLLESAKESYDKDGDNTRWGLYNGLTNAITHSMKKENPDAAIGYGKLAWEIAQTI